MKFSTGRSWITGLWIVGGLLFYLIIVAQSLQDKYKVDTEKVWAWALPTMLPTLLLMVGVHAGDALNPDKSERKVSGFFFALTFFTSAFYIIVVYLTILIAPTSSTEPILLMERSNLWLGPMQGLAAGSFGIFYMNKPAKNS